MADARSALCVAGEVRIGAVYQLWAALPEPKANVYVHPCLLPGEL